MSSKRSVTYGDYIQRYLKNHFIAYKYPILFTLFAGLASKTLTLSIPILIGQWMGNVIKENGKFFTLFKGISSVDIFWLLAISIIVKWICEYLYQKLLRIEGEKHVFDLKKLLFKQQLNLSPDYYDAYGYDKFLLRYANDMNSIRHLFNKATISIFIDVIFIIVGFIVLFNINIMITSVIIIVFIVLYVFIKIINNKIEISSYQRRNANSRWLAFINRSFRWLDSIRLFNQKEYRLKTFNNKGNISLKYAKTFLHWDSISKSTLDTLPSVILLLIIGVHQYLYSSTSISSIVVYILIFQSVLQLITNVFSIQTVIRLGLISLDKIEAILSTTSLDEEKGDILEVKNPRLEFNNIHIENNAIQNQFFAKASINQLELPSSVSFKNLIHHLVGYRKLKKGLFYINKVDSQEYCIKSKVRNIGIISTELPFTGSTLAEILVDESHLLPKKIIQDYIDFVLKNFNQDYKWLLNEPIIDKSFKASGIKAELIALIRGTVSNKRIIFVDSIPILQSTYPQQVLSLLESTKATVIFIKAV